MSHKLQAVVMLASTGAADFLGNPAGVLNVMTSGLEEFVSDVAELNIQQGSKVRFPGISA